MRRIITLLFFSSICVFGFAQTQVEMNDEAQENYIKADKELNQVYQQILKEYKDDKVFINKLKIAQRSWIKFRDADMEAMYPDEAEQGSVFPACWFMALESLTKERTEKLRIWLDGIEEGDVCAGSVKFKE